MADSLPTKSLLQNLQVLILVLEDELWVLQDVSVHLHRLIVGVGALDHLPFLLFDPFDVLFPNLKVKFQANPGIWRNKAFNGLFWSNFGKFGKTQ